MLENEWNRNIAKTVLQKRIRIDGRVHPNLDKWVHLILDCIQDPSFFKL